uniref:A-kinase anchoring protein 9 n=1 Tax=Varanus komodoensis TaxID=61221 RepID=A0A8D2LLE7_VARKO
VSSLIRPRRLKLGSAKQLAQFRQRKAHSDGQHAHKKQKKKKKVLNAKDEELVQEGLDINQSQGEDASIYSCQRGAAATSDFAIVRTLHSDDIIKHDPIYTTELESEISTTADDYSSEVRVKSILYEEEFGFGENFSENEMQHSVTRLEMMESELSGKQQEIDELNRELEEMRAAYGTEGLQQLQEFEAAIKKRDDIITQLTANLQQARKEKDETMREFLELTEQSQKLQIQFQHLQASEALRNTSHSSTAADLLQAKQQILAYQQQLEEQEQLLKNYQIKNKDFEMQVSFLQEREKCNTEGDATKKKLQEKEAVIEELEAKVLEEEENRFILQKTISAAEKSLEEIKEELFQKNQELHNMRVDLSNSKQKERQCSDEIKQLMGTVEELQKRCHKNSQHENDIVERMELETQKRLADLRAELEEVHGQQIVHMKQELVREHTTEIERLLAQQKADLERTLNLRSGSTNEDQINLMNIAINELNLMLQDANYQREKVRQDLSQQLDLLSSEKSSLQSQVEDLCQELSFSREQIQRAKQTIHEKDSKLHEVDMLQITVEELKAQLASASEIKAELELKHEAEVTNYKIKLEMLEREKDAVLDRMAESQEAELERLRTQLLFSHEEELSKLREDLQQEHKINFENFKENMGIQSKQQLDDLKNEMSKKIEALLLENDNLKLKQNHLMLEISRLKDLHQSNINSKTEEMMLQFHDLQKEIEVLRQEEKEKGTLEQEIQKLQLKTELLEKKMKEQKDSLQEKCTLLETRNNILEGEKSALQETLKKYVVSNTEESLNFTGGMNSKSEEFNLQERIENLIAANQKLIKQDIEHKEEIEKLKNSFSFMERNFEHKYQELQDKHAALQKVKLDLEENRSKHEVEYKAKLQASMEEIDGDMPVVKSQHMVVHGKKERLLRSETFEIEEVVEKDTTELMEKLEVTQREKLELSLRLSDLSDQLKLKHNQICQLNEEVISLKQDKEHISARCKELEQVVSHRLEQNTNSCKQKAKYSKGELQKGYSEVCEPENLVSDSNKEFDSTIRKRSERLTSNSLTHQIPVEELQMEAQRICLSLVYSAHVDQVRESMENEKKNALSALTEELQFHHAQELSELKKNQMDLQATKNKKTVLQETLQSLLNKIMEVYHRLLEYHAQFVKDNKKVKLKIKSPHWEDIENFKSQLEKQHAEEVEHLRSYFHQQLKETEERYTVEIVHLQSRLQDVNKSSECFRYLPFLCFNLFFVKVVVTMSVEFAQKNELTRIANLKEAEKMALVIQTQTHEENNSSRKEYPEELVSHTNEEQGMKHEEFKSLSREISEEYGETSSLEKQFQPDVKSTEILGLHNFVPTSSIVASSQISLYEERLEDMRQELVRQYEEHQQATETLKQSHMQQMEWQKENQEQLLAELSQLKIQLAESVTLDSENINTEREQMLLDELDSLKKQLIPGRKKEACELNSSGTQTQDNVLITFLPLSVHRHALQKANTRLMKILLEVLKTTVAVEETIGRHVVGLLDSSSKCQLSFKSSPWEARIEDSIKPSICVGYETEKLSSYHDSSLEGEDSSMWSEVADESFELSQYLGMEIDSKNEELVLNISSRLQAAVQKLLETINETTNQLKHAKVAQTELMRESFKQEQEVTELLKSQEELQERFDEEVKVREQLALELSKAENLIDSYTDEKSFLEKQIQEKTDAIDHLEQELLCTGNKLQELEAERQQLQEEKELLFRQKDAMNADAGPVEQRLVDAAVDAASQAELLAETEKLMKEKIEVQRQAEKEYHCLQKQVKALETDIEEQVNRFLELEQEKNAELMDLRQQNQALEKQLEKTKKFLDEQAIDREHERDVFQQEIQKLEQQLKIPQRFQPISEQQNKEVEQLTNHLKEKTDRCSELLLSKEQLQRDVQERNEEIEKLECRIRELEQALMISADSLQKVEERKQFGSTTIRGELPLEAQLQAEQEAVDRKEKEIINLEEQLEQFREELENKNEEVQQLHMQLEIQRKESTTQLQELEQENKFFKDMEKLELAMQHPEDTSIKSHHPVAGKFLHIIQNKEQELHELHEQISKLHQKLEITTNNKVIEEKNEHITELEAQIEYLRGDQERVKQNSEQEIEQLNEVIEKLQQELANIEHKIPLDLSLTQEDADNLKHQLDIVLAENESLMKQVENNDVKLSLAKSELEETKLKISKLETEVDALRKDHGRMGKKHEDIQRRGYMAEIGVKVNENLGAVDWKKMEMLKDEIPLGYMGENVKEGSDNVDTKLQQLQKALKEKDSELTQCYKELKVLKEQAQEDSEVFKQKMIELEETLKQKVAAAPMNKAQLNVVLELSKFLPEMQATLGDAKEVIRTVTMEKVNSTVGEDATSRLSELLEKLLEMEGQLANAQNNLQLEKIKVETAQKETKEKEERLAELQWLLAEAEEKHKKVRTESSKQVGIELNENEQIHAMTADPELERVRAESAAAKEELNSYREKADKFKEQLMVKETSLLHLQDELQKTKDKLAQAEEKIADYVRKEKNIEKSERICPNRTNASCQTEKALYVHSCNQTSQLPVKNEGIQIDLQNGSSSEDVAEIIREFSEKIEQMQELHAAEIMDMETRHISESEALKREQFILVQELTEECNALKDVIESLRDKEHNLLMPEMDALVVRECYSSSDWSQGGYLIPGQGSDAISEGIEDEGGTSTDFLPKKIKGLLRAIHHEGVQVLSLSEFPYNESEVLSPKHGPESWLEEREAFMSIVSSLKELIAKMQIHREAEFCAGSESSGGVPDWRTELLNAVQQVFQKEKDVLLAAYQTELAEAGVRDVMMLINQVEKKLQEQDTYQKNAVEYIQNADRRSLLAEINLLRAQLKRKSDPKKELETEPNCQELLGYNMDIQMELSSTKDRAAELQELLNSERMVIVELRNELGQTKLELETTLKAQHKHLRDLEAIRNELKGKAAELDMLKDTMASEQKKSRELQWTLEKEKAKIERSEERGKEELEDLKYSLENEKQKVKELSNLLELERELSNDLQKKVESQETLNTAQLSQERSCNSELQVLLEAERFRVLEVSSALEREKELCAQLQMAEQKRQGGTLTPAEELLQDLQKQLDEKHDRIVALVSDVERYKLESVQLKQQLEKERQIQKKTLQTEQDANIMAQKKVHELESKIEDLQWQLGEKRQQVHQLQCEEKKLQEIIQELQQKEHRKEAEVDKGTYQNLNETAWDTSNERTRKWVFQQKIAGVEAKELSCSAVTAMEEGGGGDATKECQDLQMVRQNLRNVSSKLKQLSKKAACRLPFEKSDDEDFIEIQNNIEDSLLQLQMLSDLPSTASLTERLLKQNAELTGFVSQLSEEKNNLRNVVMKLEREIRRYQQRSSSVHDGGNADALIASEREFWHKEKMTLQQSLKQAEAELGKLKAELRNESFLRELGSDSENTALKRIYGRYLRAESFRKALIYQKKYLLLLLGGFQECEEATLCLIARMGGQPSYTDLEVITHRSKAFTRFRSAVRVVIAISRMKFLVRRWHRVTGYSLIGINRDSFTQNTGNELRSDSVTGGLELYGEQRHSYRSRSELEFFRSPFGYQHRYQSINADLSPVSFTSSQLQNYDPDRALTDYISRLEALQRRLGTSASYTQLHSGTRR